MKKYVLSMFLAFALCFTFASNAFADITVGIFDFMSAMEQTEKDGALKNLKAEVDKRQAKIKEMEKKIMAAEQEIKDNQAVLSKEKLAEKIQEYQKLALEYRQTGLQYEQEIAEKRAKVLGDINHKMATIASEIAKEKNLDLVLERNEAGVLYFKDGFDYTAELVKRYKAKK